MGISGRISLAVVSGFSVWPLHYISGLLSVFIKSADAEAVIEYILVGGVFGVLVLAPLVDARYSRFGRIIALTVGSIIIYAGVVELAVSNYGWLDLNHTGSIVASGVVGALLVGWLTLLVVSLQSTKEYWTYLIIAGAVGGFLFNLAFESDYSAISAAGYAAWQVSVCWVLNLRQTVRNRSEPHGAN